MPDLTGSSFRTGVDMAAAGEHDPGQLHRRRTAAAPTRATSRSRCCCRRTMLFDSSSQVLATFTRGELVADATGRDFSSPAGFSVTLPAG